MNASTFDALARGAAGLSRRRALGLLAAALAGAAGLTAPSRRAATQTAATPPSLPTIPFGCPYYVLSGGPRLTDPFEIDDDLTVTLNDTPLLADVDGVTNILDSIAFQAAPGDRLTITATDVQGPCRKVGAIWLHCALGDNTRRLTPGQDDGCDPARAVPAVFFAETWRIGG
jgi:hypothetical protein